MRLRLPALAAAALGILLPCASSASETTESIPAARVNGVAIERAAVHELVKGLARSEPTPPGTERVGHLTMAALESLIDLELLYQEATRTKVPLSDTEIETEIAKLRRHFDSEKSFEAALAKRGLTPAGLRLDTRRTLLADRLLQRTVWRGVSVSSEEIQAFYSDNESRLEKSLDDLQDSIALMLLDDKKAELRAQFIAGLRKKATIERLPPFGDPFPKPDRHAGGESSGD